MDCHGLPVRRKNRRLLAIQGVPFRWHSGDRASPASPAHDVARPVRAPPGWNTRHGGSTRIVVSCRCMPAPPARQMPRSLGTGHPVCAWLGVAVAPLTRCTQPQCILITSPGLPHVLPVASDGRRPREGNPRGCRPQHPLLRKPSLPPAWFGDPRLRSSGCWCRTAPAAPTRLFETAMAAKTHLRKPYGPVLTRRRQID